jgi:ParB family chromosome partitioning protein
MMIEPIAIDLIDEPENAHRLTLDVDRFNELMFSIRDNGLLNPPAVVKRGARYEIIAGHRRFLACRALHWSTIFCRVYENLTPEQVEVLRADENLQRQDLSTLEELHVIQTLHDVLKLDRAQIADKLNRSYSWVDQRFALLNLPEHILLALDEGELKIGHALELGRIDDKLHQNYLFEYCKRDGCTVNICRAWVDDYLLRRSQGEPVQDIETELPFISQKSDIPCTCEVCHSRVRYGDTILLRVCTRCNEIRLEE